MLRRAGIIFTARRPSVDEAALKREARGLEPAALALHLAGAKAASVSRPDDEHLVVGADQVLNLDGAIFDKPESRAKAYQQLTQLSGRAHRLETAVCCARASRIVWRHNAAAVLHVRTLGAAEIDRYLDRIGDDALTSVGAYKLEALGVQLFERVEGDFFTILGLPLLPLLAFLRAEGAVAL